MNIIWTVLGIIVVIIAAVLVGERQPRVKLIKNAIVHERTNKEDV